MLSDSWVVVVQDGETGCRQGGHELALGSGHAVEVTEVLDVGLGHPGHDADVGTRDAGEPLDVARLSGPHLEDDPPRRVRGVEQGQGQAQLVVEGTLVGRAGERRGQAAGQEVLGGGLADRPGDADGAADPISGERPEAQQCGGGVVDPDGRSAHGLSCGEVGRGARLERRRDEGVAVTLGHDGDVELPGPDGPRVDARSIDADVGPDQSPPRWAASSAVEQRTRHPLAGEQLRSIRDMSCPPMLGVAGLPTRWGNRSRCLGTARRRACSATTRARRA